MTEKKEKTTNVYLVDCELLKNATIGDPQNTTKDAKKLVGRVAKSNENIGRIKLVTVKILCEPFRVKSEIISKIVNVGEEKKDGS
jgi:hypothetical protein